MTAGPKDPLKLFPGQPDIFGHADNNRDRNAQYGLQTSDQGGMFGNARSTANGASSEEKEEKAKKRNAELTVIASMYADINENLQALEEMTKQVAEERIKSKLVTTEQLSAYINKSEETLVHRPYSEESFDSMTAAERRQYSAAKEAIDSHPDPATYHQNLENILATLPENLQKALIAKLQEQGKLPGNELSLATTPSYSNLKSFDQLAMDSMDPTKVIVGIQPTSVASQIIFDGDVPESKVGSVTSGATTGAFARAARPQESTPALAPAPSPVQNSDLNNKPSFNV